MSLEIKGFIETSFLDWDGKVVASVYVSACNFKCPFCHNGDLIENPNNYETISVEKIKDYLKTHKDFIDGICLTGGEPSLYKNAGLFEFLKEIKGMGFLVKLDTNGTDPSVIEKVVSDNLVDYIAMDIKGPIDDRYDKLTGVKTDLNEIKKSVELIMSSGIDYEFRTTVVPTLLTTKDVHDIAKYLEGAKKFMLQQFVGKNTWDKNLRNVKPYSKEKLEEMIEKARPYIENIALRGIKDV